jgi:hypothetical protein
LARAPARNINVFVNCPFDDDYLPCFEALLFAITICGYQARCALEDDDSGDIRFDKLCRLVAESDHTIHDLSRTQLGDRGLPRFNMPFELGLMMGAKRFGAKRQRQKRACVMVAEPFVLPRYLSDIAGADPAAHGNEPREVIRIIRDHFHRDPKGKVLPGAQHFNDLFDTFRADLGKLAANAHLTAEEVHARRGYRNYMDMLRAFCEALPEIAKSGGAFRE